MPDSYTMQFPPKIIFGADTVTQLPDNLTPNARIMLVTGKSARSNGLLERLETILTGFEVTTVCGVMPEPTLDEVDRLIDIGRKNQVDTVVAVGGGSVMDTAKAAACIIANDGCIRDYFNGTKQIIDRGGVALIALPTTSGTGAEITPNSVFIDPDTQVKKSMRHRYIIPDLAIVDPVLTVSAPESVTAASGLDALTQAIEAYTTKAANNTTDALTYKAIDLIYHNLGKACRNPEDLEARTAMAEGSMLTAIAFAQCGLGAVHGIGHPIGSLLHLPHGLTCAILLVPVMEWNKEVVGDKLAELAKICGGQTADDFIEKIRKLRADIGVASDFRAAGLTQEHYEFIIKNCRSGSMRANPRDMTDEDVEQMLRQLS